MGYRLGDTGDRRRKMGWRPGDKLLLAGCIVVVVIALWLAWDTMQ